MWAAGATVDAGRWYRVEHRVGQRVAVLGSVRGVAAHHQSLAPFAARLLHEGATGEVVLVDEATGADVARRKVRPRWRPLRP